MGFFEKQVVLTEEEQQLFDMISAMVSNPQCNIDVDPNTMQYLLDIESLQYFVIIDSVGVEFSNHNFCVARRLSSKGLDAIKKLVADESSRRWVLKRDTISKNQKDLIEKIKTNVGNGTN
jgi:hypothetical protein